VSTEKEYEDDDFDAVDCYRRKGTDEFYTYREEVFRLNGERFIALEDLATEGTILVTPTELQAEFDFIPIFKTGSFAAGIDPVCVGSITASCSGELKLEDVPAFIGWLEQLTGMDEPP
jgi:hypothetical protein